MYIGAEGAVAGQPVVHHIGRLGGDVILQVVQGKVAEDRGVQQVTHQVVFGELRQFAGIFGFQRGLSLLQPLLEVCGLFRVGAL